MGQRLKKKICKCLAYENNAMEAMDVAKNSQGEPVGDHVDYSDSKGSTRKSQLRLRIINGIEVFTNSLSSPKAYRRSIFYSKSPECLQKCHLLPGSGNCTVTKTSLLSRFQFCGAICHWNLQFWRHQLRLHFAKSGKLESVFWMIILYTRRPNITG